MEYHIVTGSSLSALEHAVRQFIADGWLPQGGPFSFQQGAYPMVGQAMTRTRK